MSGYSRYSPWGSSSISWGHFTAAGPAMAATMEAGLIASGFTGFTVRHTHTRSGDYFGGYQGNTQFTHTSVHSPGGTPSAAGQVHTKMDGPWGAPHLAPIARITPTPVWSGYTPSYPTYVTAGVSAYTATNPAMPTHTQEYNFTYSDVRGRPSLGTSGVGVAMVQASCNTFGAFSRAGLFGGGKSHNYAIVNLVFEIYDLKTNEIINIIQIHEIINYDDTKKYQKLDKKQILNLEIYESQYSEIKKIKLSDISLTEKQCEEIFDFLYERICFVLVASSVLLEFTPKFLIPELKEELKEKSDKFIKPEIKEYSGDKDYYQKYLKYKTKYENSKNKIT